MKVLVADDSETQRRLVGGLLKELGLEIVEASSGAEALDLMLRADAPNIAVLDWEMPGLSGVEVVQRVREASREVRPHLLLVTSRADRADIVEALKAGADDYLTKPPHPPELRGRVQVGVRNVQLQQELQVRITELKDTLRRLDVVGALAAQDRSKQAVAKATREGGLRQELEALDAVRALPERVASVLGNLGQAGKDQRPELWAHLALALPSPGSWLDVTLEVSRELAGLAVKQLTGKPAENDQSMLDCVGDVLTLLMRGFQQQLEAVGLDVLKPHSARALVGAAPRSQAPKSLSLHWEGWTLQVHETPEAVSESTFAQLMPGTMLVRALNPPALPKVEVLAKGTVLKPSYLLRAGSFFKGDAANTPVQVMPVSAFSRDHRP